MKQFRQRQHHCNNKRRVILVSLLPLIFHNTSSGFSICSTGIPTETSLFQKEDFVKVSSYIRRGRYSLSSLSKDTETAPPSSDTAATRQLSKNSKNKNHRQQQLTKVTARFVAACALVRNNKGSEFSLQRLDSDLPKYPWLDQRDRSFARLLVTTVERRMGQIDKILQHCYTNKKKYAATKKKRLSRQDGFVQACLRVGAAQLLFLDVAPYAAIKETIDVLRMNPKLTIPEAKIKFANAVLRRISREGQDMLHEYTSPLDNIAPWLLKEFNTSWGKSNTNKIVSQFMVEPSIDLSINYPLGATPDERAALLEQVQDEFGNDSIILPQGSLRVGKNTTGAVSDWPFYSDGLWWVQDASAALPALALCNALLPDNNIQDLHIVDCCAAPGGKTAQLVSLGFGHVTAIEANARRSRRLVDNLERLQIQQDRCTVCVADGSEWVPDDNIDIRGVLLDVPCSATGTGAKRPDVLRREEDLGNLLEVQQRLAEHVADNILDIGGVMVYATCSLLKRESEDQVEKLLSRNDKDGNAVMETIPFTKGEIPGFDQAIDEHGWLRVLPGVLPGNLSSCDGFFVARLRKVK